MFGLDDAAAVDLGLGAANFLGGIFGGSSANKAAQAAAQAQMDFQKQTLQNRHQWEVNDLRAAGLNPILSANSGAPGASGASYVPQNVMGSATSAGISQFGKAAQNALTKAQIDATNASASASVATAKNQIAQAALNSTNAQNNSYLTPGLRNTAVQDTAIGNATNPAIIGASRGSQSSFNQIGQSVQGVVGSVADGIRSLGTRAINSARSAQGQYQLNGDYSR